MGSTLHAIALAVPLAVLATGCAAAPLACRPGEPTVNCCIKKFPLSPRESCAAQAAEILEALNGLRMAVDEGEFTNNADLPEWKQRCIKGYVLCVDQGWPGNCYECLRLCEGQQKWPEHCPSPD